MREALPAARDLPFERGSELFRRTTLLLDRILANIRLEEEAWRLRRTIER